ncbi:M20 family metallopeptidase [Microaceticoccus formicicus]|uniref:M20 family metallopeptidase n=1 Tax=Microaceticoccus formicicus TaxID=3118105 RepID=UPI003CD01700|nr:M20 family metallopeptidase [Peptoniphilaceae bacterium AMB_02]
MRYSADNNSIDHISLLSELIEFPSINPPGDEEQISEFIYEFMTNNKIETIRVPVTEKRNNIISRLKGKNSENGIIFTGHMDVVPVSLEEKQKWISEPFTPKIKENKIYGRGSCDMKSGLAAAMISMVRLARSNTIPERDNYLVATVDEEDSMLGSKELWNHPLLLNATEVIVCEPTKLKVCTASRGRTYGLITVKGQTGHGSSFKKENNAILIANLIIEKMLQTNFDEFANPEYGDSFWQPLAINAGVEPCVVPDICTMKIDARLTIGHNPKDIWSKLNSILNEIYSVYPNINIEYNIIDEREPWETDKNSKLYKKVKDTFNEMGLPLETDYFPGTTDGTILRRANREVLIIGPGDLKYAHRENEHISIAEYELAIEMYYKIMQK